MANTMTDEEKNVHEVDFWKETIARREADTKQSERHWKWSTMVGIAVAAAYIAVEYLKIKMGA